MNYYCVVYIVPNGGSRGETHAIYRSVATVSRGNRIAFITKSPEKRATVCGRRSVGNDGWRYVPTRSMNCGQCRQALLEQKDAIKAGEGRGEQVRSEGEAS